MGTQFNSPCLNTPASRSFLQLSMASGREEASPFANSQSTKSLPTKHCLYEVKWYFLSTTRFDPSPFNLMGERGMKGGRGGRGRGDEGRRGK